jgi:hypothetical protein
MADVPVCHDDDCHEWRIKMKSRSILMAGAALGLALLAGCGGGGGGGIPNNGGTGGVGNLAGAVTDVNGKSVAGATVFVGGRTATSVSNGSFTISGVPDGYQLVQVNAPVNGLTYSGQTWVDLIAGENNRSVNVMVSDSRYQSALEGYVQDGQGNLLQGIKVFIQGPYGSTMAFTDNNGYYKAQQLPPNTNYTVVASFAGYLNQTQSFSSYTNQTSRLDFALYPGNSQGTIAPPTNVSAESWTTALDVTRSESKYQKLYDWVKSYFRKKKGLPAGVQAKVITRMKPLRSTPNGSLVETDLYWTPVSQSNLLGYLIRRGTSSSNLVSEAVLRDPLASAFFDADPALTPDVIYYYTVNSLDTIEFPNNGTYGSPSSIVTSQPMDAMRAQYPVQKTYVSGDPVFQWSSVNGATSYQVFVWNDFPDLQSSTDPNGITPIWGPGSAGSLVTGSQTTLQYNGPILQSGGIYHWMVVATDGQGNYSATQIASFVEQ